MLVTKKEKDSELENEKTIDTISIPLYALVFSKWDKEDMITFIQSPIISLLGLIILFVVSKDFIIFPIITSLIISMLYIGNQLQFFQKAKNFRKKYPYLFKVCILKEIDFVR